MPHILNYSVYSVQHVCKHPSTIARHHRVGPGVPTPVVSAKVVSISSLDPDVRSIVKHWLAARLEGGGVKAPRSIADPSAMPEHFEVLICRSTSWVKYLSTGHTESEPRLEVLVRLAEKWARQGRREDGCRIGIAGDDGDTIAEGINAL